MAISATRVTVTTTETLLVTPSGRTKVSFFVSTGTMFVGATGVTSSTGFQVADKHEFELSDGDALYGITASGTAAVQVITTN